VLVTIPIENTTDKESEMKSTLLTLALTIMLASTVTAQQNTAPVTKKLYIEEYIETTLTRFVSTTDEVGVLKNNESSTARDVSLIVKNDVTKECPSIVTVTDRRDGADYVLHIAHGSSTLSLQDGNVAYSSKSKWKHSNLAKDVCKFIGSQK
jgi:hypothetical protein